MTHVYLLGDLVRLTISPFALTVVDVQDGWIVARSNDGECGGEPDHFRPVLDPDGVPLCARTEGVPDQARYVATDSNGSHYWYSGKPEAMGVVYGYRHTRRHDLGRIHLGAIGADCPQWKQTLRRLVEKGGE